MREIGTRCLKLWVVATALGITACGPSENQKQQLAEKKRIECLDQFCEGDVEPKRDMAAETALKLHGQWYIAPKYYYSTGMNGAAFYWPSKKNREDVPSNERAVPFANTVEILLTGRQRWSMPSAATPWKEAGWEGRFKALQQQGLRIERKQLRPELERIRFFDSQGLQYRHEYYLATQQRKIRGDGAPGVACDHPDDRPNALPRCTGGDFWQEDVYADFRFHAKHATNWPAIHQEIVRILSLAKKVQP